MLLARNQTIVGLVAAALLGAATLFAISVEGGLFVTAPVLEAEFADAAGLGPGDFVLVAGVQNGEVLDVVREGDHVVARFTLSDAGKLPADSTASITIRNTLGKPGIALTPGSSEDRLEDGVRIPLERTDTPVDLPELGDRTAELLGGVDVDALDDLVTALADVTEGKREEVEQLLHGVQEVSDIVVERRDELAGVLEHGERLVDAAADRDQELVTIIEEFGSTLDVLVQRRDDITRLLQETALTSDIAADLVEDRRGQIDEVLAELHDSLEIVDEHQVDLAHVMAYAGVGVEGFASIGYQGGEARRDNPSWGNVFVTGLGAAGIDAIAGCGGPIDEVFTALVGPDPRCDEDPNRSQTPEEDPPDDGSGADEDDAGPIDDLPDDLPPDDLSAPVEYGGLAGFFDLATHARAGGQR